MERRVVMAVIACFLIAVLGCATPHEQMRKAVKTNDVNLAEKALGDGVRVDNYFIDSVRESKYAIVLLLLAKGADVNKSETAFKIDGDVVIAKDNPITDGKTTLSRYQYKVKKITGKGGLHYAIKNNDSEMVKILLEAGAMPNIEYVVINPSVLEFKNGKSDEGYIGHFHNDADNVFHAAVNGRAQYWYKDKYPDGKISVRGKNKFNEKEELVTDHLYQYDVLGSHGGDLNNVIPKNILNLVNGVIVKDGIIDAPCFPYSGMEMTPIAYARSLGRSEIAKMIEQSMQNAQSEK